MILGIFTQEKSGRKISRNRCLILLPRFSVSKFCHILIFLLTSHMVTAADVCRSRALPGTELELPVQLSTRSMSVKSSITNLQAASGGSITPSSITPTSLAPAGFNDTTLRDLGTEPDDLLGDGIEDITPGREKDQEAHNEPKDGEDDKEDGDDQEDEDDKEDEDEQDKEEQNKPKQVQFDPYANWDNGEDLTKEERAAVLALGSNYERSRMMNIRRRERLEVECGLREAVNAIRGMMAAAPKRKATRKPERVAAPARRSARVVG